MSRTHISSTPRNLMNALRFQGILVSENHAQLQAMLEKSLSAEHALFFAEPVQDAAGKSVDWYTPLALTPEPLASLPYERQRAARAAIARIAGDIETLAESLKAEGRGSRFVRGGILSTALRYPGEEYIYVIGEQPVLTGWGFGPATLGLEPEPLIRLGSPLPPPPRQAPPAASPTDPRPAEQRSKSPGPVLSFVIGILLLLGAYLLAALLFGPSGCPSLRDAAPAGCAPSLPQVSGCSRGTGSAGDPGQQPASPDFASGMASEQERERALRSQLEDLRGQLSRRMSECPRPVQEPPRPEPRTEEPPEPEEPPSLAELMPTTPEPPKGVPPPKKTPPKADPPKVDPPKTAPPKPKQPEPPKSPDLVIPEGALENNDLSFLEGCWNNATTLKDGRTRLPIRSTYCFDKNGKGTRTERGIGHDLNCNGSANARFVNGQLRINANEAQCTARGRGKFRYPKEAIVCDRTVGGKADCYESQNDRWKARLQRVN